LVWKMPSGNPAANMQTIRFVINRYIHMARKRRLFGSFQSSRNFRPIFLSKTREKAAAKFFF
jgi:hypothetical protein